MDMEEDKPSFDVIVSKEGDRDERSLKDHDEEKN